MQSMQSEQTQNEPELDLRDNAGKIGAIDELLGLTAETPATPEKGEPTDTELSVSEVLAEAEKSPDGSESNKAVKPPKTLADLAERTGIKVEDLYAIELPAQADGAENPTFGSLKDLAAEQSDFAGRELKLEERRVTLENEQAGARQDLEFILKSLPPDAIKPEALQRAREQREVFLDREAARVLDVIPEWSDDKVKRGELAGIGEHMGQYGFDQNHINQVADHRMLRYMRDNFVRMKLVEKALATAKPVKKVPTSRKSQPAKPTAPVTATPQSSLNDQLSAIDLLLK